MTRSFVARPFAVRLLATSGSVLALMLSGLASTPSVAAPIEALPAATPRPVIAVFGDNAGTEAVDFMVPYGVLSEADIADVVAVSLTEGPLRLRPALTVQTAETLASFDARYPLGADYVIIPAIAHPDDPAVLAWLRAQAAKGATLVSICDGAWTLAATGLLDGRRGTAHWASIKGLTRAYPRVDWVRDQRYVGDTGVLSSTGVSAALPTALALVERIGGREIARRVAADHGVVDWSAAYDSQPFRLTAGAVSTALVNTVAFWSHDRVGVRIDAGVDEVTLALTLDPLARTYRTKAYTVSATPDPVPSENGLSILPDLIAPQGADGAAPRGLAMVIPSQQDPLGHVLTHIGRTYGGPTQRLVSLQLEDPAR